MSRGPGRIERAITDAFEARPDEALTTEQLCALVYPGANRIEKKHRVAVIRAGEKVCAKLPGWSAIRSEEAGGSLIWFNAYSVTSYALMKCRRSFHPRTTDAARAMIEPGGRFHHSVVEGGSWWRHVQLAIAKRDGDMSERTKELEERQAQDMQTLALLMRQPTA